MIPALLKATALTVACLVFCSRHIDAFNVSSFDEIICGDQGSLGGKHVSAADFRKGVVTQDDIMFRHGSIKGPKKWPSNVIPIHSYFHRSLTEKIFDWLKSVEEHSCVKIVQRRCQKDFISFTNIALPNFSELGFRGGQQVINFSKGQSKGLALHLFMHALGFWHEHSRVDRNQYVSVVWDNIDLSNRGYFQSHVRQVYGQPYDFSSIMHGSEYDFALDNDIKSIVPVVRNLNISEPIGQRSGLSEIDFAKLNEMFNCGQISQSTPPVPITFRY